MLGRNMCTLSDGKDVRMTPAPPQVDQVVSQTASKWEDLGRLLPGAPEAEGAAKVHSAPARQDVAYKLIMNHEAVFRDCVNNTNSNVVGVELTQTTLKRVDPNHAMYVDQCLREVARRLLGRVNIAPEQKNPSDAAQSAAWNATSMYMLCRLQSVPDEMPGRTPDMTPAAAFAMRAVLAEVGQV